MRGRGGGGGFLSRELVWFLMLVYLAPIMTPIFACTVGWQDVERRHKDTTCPLLLSFYYTRFKNWLPQWQTGHLLKNDTKSYM